LALRGLNGSEAAYAGFGALSSHAVRLVSWLSLRGSLLRMGWLADLRLFVTPITKRRAVGCPTSLPRTGAQANSKEAGKEILQLMAKIVFGMNLSLDGYVDHEAFAPDPVLFRHFIEQMRGLTGSVYGRRMYEVMRYWDEDRPDWDAEERDFATAWRSQPKWVVSRSLKSVGPNATLVEDDIEAVYTG
jgi:hypothetical protein